MIARKSLLPPFVLGIIIYVAIILSANFPLIGFYRYSQTGLPSMPYHWLYMGGDWPNILIYKPIFWAPLYIVNSREINLEQANLYTQPYWILVSLALTIIITKIFKKVGR